MGAGRTVTAGIIWSLAGRETAAMSIKGGGTVTATNIFALADVVGASGSLQVDGKILTLFGQPRHRRLWYGSLSVTNGGSVIASQLNCAWSGSITAFDPYRWQGFLWRCIHAQTGRRKHRFSATNAAPPPRPL